MQRQKDDSITSRVYVYGCVPERVAPVHNEDRALEQMRLGQRLWNVLVAIDRARVARYRRIMADEAQERIDALRDQAAALRDEIKTRRKQARKRSVDIGDLAERLAAVKSELSALIEEQKRTSTERHDARRAELTAMQERTNHRIKRARQAAASLGLFWGTYNDIVQRSDAGRKHGGELHFRGFRGEGTLTAQIMGGAIVTRCVEGAHTFFQVDPPQPGRKWRYARMRIGSEERGGVKLAPVWLEIPIVYHRDLPPAGMIKSVSMTRRMLAGKPRWQLNVTLNLPAPKPTTRTAAVAIDIGWRLLPEGVRVAYWMDDAGQHGQVLIPSRDISQFERVRSLRSNCDLSRDEILPGLAEWFGGLELPAEWAQRVAYLSQWRSSDRLAGLYDWWRDHRLPGDAETFEAYTTWRKQYLHLAHWWRNLQDQMTLRVREQYRVFAAQLAGRYGVVYIEDFDLSSVARKPKTEGDGEKSASSTYRQMVSPSMFRGALLNALQREGATVTELPAEYTTRICSTCGYGREWDQAESVMHRCGGCGEMFDQDENAAKNLLRLVAQGVAG